MTLPNGDVADRRATVVSLVGGGKHCRTRLSKESVVKVYYALADGEVPGLVQLSDAWQWPDAKRRRAVADLAGFEYDPPTHSLRSFNSAELRAIVAALEDAEVSDGQP
ncbi:hypothetical protein [Natrinema thermotolerans]|uniref:hypothetical protein n=1 Tax=Natrinema thermotolerans TaxID=121872 RepID=UPI0006788930|nr:hypothetical protein [Natrinema thermotolerans]QCC57246.1 hypothetical protein DVR14_00805 [Natrinema thermotolerans]